MDGHTYIHLFQLIAYFYNNSFYRSLLSHSKINFICICYWKIIKFANFEIKAY